MTKLTNIRQLGRFKCIETNREYNIKKGRNAQRGTDHLYYLYKGKRMFINDSDFYHNYEQVEEIVK